MAVVLGLKALSKTFAGNFCLLRCIGPTACTHDAVRYYRASDKPVRPQNSYMLYVNSVQAQIRQEHPELKQKEVVKLIAIRYRQLGDEQLQELRLSAAQRSAEYKKEMEEYLNSLTKEELEEMKKEEAKKKRKKVMKRIHKEQKELNKPKKSMTAFFHFAAACKEKGDLGTTDMIDGMKEIGARWRALPDSEKEAYQVVAKREKAEYDKNLDAWEREMIEEKKYHLVREKQLFEITGIKRKQTKKTKRRVVSKKTAKTAKRKTAKKKATVGKKAAVAKKESTAAKKESTGTKKESAATKMESKMAKAEPSFLGSETGMAKTPRKKRAVSKKQSKVDVAMLSDSDSD